MEHAVDVLATSSAAAEAAEPEEVEDKAELPEADWGGSADDLLSEITDNDDEQDEVPAENEQDEVPAENENEQDEVPAENELPILCRFRADLQDGRHVIFSSKQTLEEWQALSDIRASVEQKLRDAGGASQPPGGPLEFGYAERAECLNKLRQRWLDSGAPASKKCKFEGTQKEWEEKELREGCPSFRGNKRKFYRACANHWRWALTSVVSRRAFRPRLGASPTFAMLRGWTPEIAATSARKAGLDGLRGLLGAPRLKA